MRFRNQSADWWRKHFRKSVRRPEIPQDFRRTQFFLAHKRREADFVRPSLKRREADFQRVNVYAPSATATDRFSESTSLPWGMNTGIPILENSPGSPDASLPNTSA